MNPIKLLVVDDHVMFREGLARALERESGFALVGQVGSTAEAIPFARNPKDPCDQTKR